MGLADVAKLKLTKTLIINCINLNFLTSLILLAAYLLIKLVIAYFITKFISAIENLIFKTNFWE